MNTCQPAKPAPEVVATARIHSFHPPQPALLGPGPSDIHPRAIAAMGQQKVAHLETGAGLGPRNDMGCAREVGHAEVARKKHEKWGVGI
jgi:hypothetical protein